MTSIPTHYPVELNLYIRWNSDHIYNGRNCRRYLCDSVLRTLAIVLIHHIDPSKPSQKPTTKSTINPTRGPKPYQLIGPPNGDVDSAFHGWTLDKTTRLRTSDFFK